MSNFDRALFWLYVVAAVAAVVVAMDMAVWRPN